MPRQRVDTRVGDLVSRDLRLKQQKDLLDQKLFINVRKVWHSYALKLFFFLFF